MFYFAEISPRNSPYGLEWGGGANSLDSPKTGDNSDFESEENDADLSENDKKERNTTSEYTYKTYKDYFIDFTVPTKREDTTITGEGNVSSPLQINSFEDFLYVCKYENFSKTVDINCDLILNDETFDANGKPHGGDGVVYAWKGINASWGTFNFHNHSVRGLYINDETMDCAGFFGENYISSVSNLVFENVFLKGNNYVAPIASKRIAEDVKNCINKSGYVYGNGHYVSGLFIEFRGNGNNCINYADVTGQASYVSGISWFGGNLFNCKNFGKIKGNGVEVAGIVSRVGGSQLSRCINYGNVSGINTISGLFGRTNFVNLLIKNCLNYGKIEGDEAVGSIISTLYTGLSFVEISNCSNYGKILSRESYYKAGELVGFINLGNNTKTIINIFDCNYVSTNGHSLIGHFIYTVQNQELTINIKNITAKYEDCLWEPQYLIISNNIYDYTLNASNIFVEYDNENFSMKLFENAKKLNIKCSFHNILFQGKCENFEQQNLICQNVKNLLDLDIKSVVWDLKNYRYYYGDNFSDYYYSYKTGRIGLSFRENTGGFQGVVTEDKLQSMGYIKQEL